jgi:hypothetical protein
MTTLQVNIVHTEGRAVAKLLRRYLERSKFESTGKIRGMLYGKELRVEWIGDIATLYYDHAASARRLHGITPEGDAVWKTINDYDDRVWFIVGKTACELHFMPMMFLVS